MKKIKIVKSGRNNCDNCASSSKRKQGRFILKPCYDCESVEVHHTEWVPEFVLVVSEEEECS